MIFVVNIGYDCFYFDSIIEATSFATLAKEHYGSHKYGTDTEKTINVSIEFVLKED